MSRRRKSPLPNNPPHSENPIPPARLPSPPQPKNNPGISFIQVSHLLPVFVFAEILTHALEEIERAQEKIETISDRINQGLGVKDTNSIIESIHLLISLKESTLHFISWISVIAGIINCELDNDYPLEIIISILQKMGDRLTVMSQIMDFLLTNVPSETILGITLAPDQKQFSETKATIAKILSRLEERRQEEQEAEKDWGKAEQSAYERMQVETQQNIPVEEFLDWLDRLERGDDV
jgi:hypothetical protein